MPNAVINAYFSDKLFAKYLNKKEKIMPELKKAVKEIIIKHIGGK